MQIRPFRPSAGAEPPRIIGRDQAIVDFVSGLEGGVGAPGSLMHITGPRGSGKTVLLSDLSFRAHELGWNIANVTAGAGLLDDLIYELSTAAVTDAFSVSGLAAVISGDVSGHLKRPNLRALMKDAAGRGRGLSLPSTRSRMQLLRTCSA